MNVGAPAEPERLRTPVDTHVHLHDRFDLVRALEAARRHFASLRPEGARGDGVLAVAATDGRADPIDRVRSEARSRGLAGWDVEELEQGIIASAGDGSRIALVPGRQVATREGLEVLALAHPEPLAASEELGTTVRTVVAQGGVPVVPWGFGKWFGRRGRILRAALGAEASFFLGDSGLRAGSGSSALFQQASREGRTLAGSDPLDLPGHEERVGNFGNWLRGEPDWSNPAGWLRHALTELDGEPARFGGRCSSLGSLADQLRLRLRLRPGR